MKKAVYIILIILFIYTSFVCAIQRFSNPKLSETELFLLIPENIILTFK